VLLPCGARRSEGGRRMRFSSAAWA
jgi:hypothetical protein